MQFRCVFGRGVSSEIQRDGTAGHKESSPFCRFQVYYVTVPLPMEGRLRMAARRSALQQSRLPGGDPRVLRLRAKFIPQHCNRQQPVTMMHRCITKDTVLLVVRLGRGQQFPARNCDNWANVCSFYFFETDRSGTLLHSYFFIPYYRSHFIESFWYRFTLAEGTITAFALKRALWTFNKLSQKSSDFSLVYRGTRTN